MSSKHQAGLTLVELIIAMVIISVGLAGVLAALSRVSTSSALPMRSKQMAALAEGMLEEVQLRQVTALPNVFTANNACARNHYNDVWDYNGYARTSICDIDGNVLPQFTGYTVTVAVANVANNHVMTTNGVPAASAIAITVQVSDGTSAHELRGWRTSY
ncbi:prepilin-type N-terminal cleavage/methylation domain-containing protein [Massilia sp. SR12]